MGQRLPHGPQLLQQHLRQRVRGHAVPLHGKGGGDVRDIRWKGRLRHVDADAHHQPLRTAVRPQGGLRQDAAQLFPVQHHVVAPLDAAHRAADLLDGSAHGHRRQRRDGEQLPSGAAAPQDGQVQPALRRQERAPQTAFPGGLTPGDDRRVVRALRGQRLAYVIGGIHFIAAQDAPCHRRHLPSSETQFYHREPYL